MTRVQKLERAIAELSPAEMRDLRLWFSDFDAAQWDRALDNDVASGALDRLAEQAIAEHRAGTTSEL